MSSLGSIGEQLDLYVRQGDTLGPYLLTFTDAAGNPVNLTGYVFDAACSLLSDPADVGVSMAATITNAAAGQVTISLTAAGTSGLTNVADYFSSSPTYAWRLKSTDAAGNVQTWMTGKLYIAPGALP